MGWAWQAGAAKLSSLSIAASRYPCRPASTCQAAFAPPARGSGSFRAAGRGLGGGLVRHGRGRVREGPFRQQLAHVPQLDANHGPLRVIVEYDAGSDFLAAFVLYPVRLEIDADGAGFLVVAGAALRFVVHGLAPRSKKRSTQAHRRAQPSEPGRHALQSP